MVTASRGLCGPLLLWGLMTRGPSMVWFWLFLLAICTDLVDGWLARRLGGTRWGKFLDPLADKLLTTCTWVGLLACEVAPGWMVFLMVTRDVALLVLGTVATMRAFTPPTLHIGQIRVAIEGVALCVLLFVGPWIGVDWPTVGYILACLALCASLASSCEFMVRWHRQHLPR
jgi:CDP-diacylglycerol--glycerol-3-phosphate 3-phosphatidyltransferase